jgi:hypothetical protein
VEATLDEEALLVDSLQEAEFSNEIEYPLS